MWCYKSLTFQLAKEYNIIITILLELEDQYEYFIYLILSSCIMQDLHYF